MEGGENVCGGNGATLHVEASSKCDRMREGCPKEASTTWSMRLSHRGGETAASSFTVRLPGSLSSSYPSGLRAVENPSCSVPACGKDLARSNGVFMASGNYRVGPYISGILDNETKCREYTIFAWKSS